MQPRRKVLHNGLRIVVVPLKDNPTVTVLALVAAGANYESKKQNGISHFLEHMIFKGTPTRPSAAAIAHELDSIGADNNAFTDREYTGYYAKARKKHFAHILEVVSDLYLHPLLPEVEMEKERGVIIEELNMYQDQPQDVVRDRLDTLMYGEQPAGRHIGGTKAGVKKLTREDLVLYHKQYYVPKATTIVVAGDVAPGDVFRRVEKLFGSVPKEKKPTKPNVRVKQRKPQITVAHRKSDQTHLIFGFHGPTIHDKKVPATSVMTTILGRGMSSRLFQSLREELGICYYVGAYPDLHSDYGRILIYAGVDTKRTEEAVEAILHELRHIRTDRVQTKELQKAQEYIAGKLLMNSEGSDERAALYGAQEILSRPLETPHAYIRRIKKVTARDVEKVAHDIFQNKHVNLAVVGPQKGVGKLSKIVKL